MITINISQHAKDLVLILDHNHTKQQRITAAKLIDIWRSKKQNSGRPVGVATADMTIELCERILVTTLLEGT